MWGIRPPLCKCGLEANPPERTWIPTLGVARQRLRVTSLGRLKMLETRMNRTAWVAYHDLRGEIEQAKAELKAMRQPP